MRLVLLLALSAGACAQPASNKPAAGSEGRDQRADSVIERRVTPAVASSPADSMVTVTRDLLAGETVVRVRVHERMGTPISGPGEAPIRLDALNLHDDESTSVDAALDVVRQRGGRVVELVHSSDRNLTFSVGGRPFVADPNRMFTEAGRRRTLAALSSDDPGARRALAAFADSVLAVYTSSAPGVVVTLHNNTSDRYSARSYQPGGEYASDAQAVTVHPGSDPDDFFFVTDRALYDALAGRGFNAVLQDNAAATDDGSLSVWAAQHGVPYVNVEAEHGHRAEQARMIAALADVLAAGR